MILSVVRNSTAKLVSRLYQSHGAIVLRRARQILGNEEAAEDILQELFRALLERPEQISGVKNEVAWFYRATTHLCLNKIRNRKNRERLLREKVAPVGAESASSETRALVSQAIEQLPDDLATVFVHYYVDQMTHAEIAEVVQCSRRQVGNLLERAHERLRTLFGLPGDQQGQEERVDD